MSRVNRVWRSRRSRVSCHMSHRSIWHQLKNNGSNQTRTGTETVPSQYTLPPQFIIIHGSLLPCQLLGSPAAQLEKSNEDPSLQNHTRSWERIQFNVKKTGISMHASHSLQHIHESNAHLISISSSNPCHGVAIAADQFLEEHVLAKAVHRG